MKLFWLFFLPVITAYGTTGKWILDRWMLPDSYYSHGPLVPLVAAAMVFLRRDSWGAVPARADARGWWILGPGLALHLCGAALMIDSLSAASLMLSTVGVVWVSMGLGRLNRLWPVLALAVFAIPMPIFMTGRLAFELKEVAIDASEFLTTLLGVEVFRSAADLYVHPHKEPLQVADACSGLRSLIALTTLGYCVAFFMGPQRGLRRWILLVSAVPIAVVTNIVRITGICIWARFEGVQSASTTGHDILRWVAWIVAFGLLLLLDKILSRWAGEAVE